MNKQMKRVLMWTVALIVSVFSVECAVAQDAAIARASNSPISDARPGEYFFMEGVKAVKANDYRHAVYMYKVAASWAYKPAQYNLGVIFAKGEGSVVTDMPQGLAWLTLAAERNDGSNEHKKYAEWAEKVRSACDNEQLAESAEILAELSKTYSDEHALPRARLRWNEVRMNVTGSHVGAIGNLTVGSSGPSNVGAKLAAPKHAPGPASMAPPGMATAADLSGGHGTDGSISYRELRATDNPYDPSWDVGTVTVGDIETVAKKPADDKATADAAKKN